jgi:hypothetical protein
MLAIFIIIRSAKNDMMSQRHLFIPPKINIDARSLKTRGSNKSVDIEWDQITGGNFKEVNFKGSSAVAYVFFEGSGGLESIIK